MTERRSPELREAWADVSHDIWAHWMRYMFSKCDKETRYSMDKITEETGCLIIPSELVERWQRQIETPYSQLTEKERESDREQADKILLAFAKTCTSGADFPKVHEYVSYMNESNSHAVQEFGKGSERCVKTE